MASTPLPPASTPSSGTSTVAIDLGDRSYDILIGEGLLQDPATFAGLPKSSKALIVTNTTVGPLYTPPCVPRSPRTTRLCWTWNCPMESSTRTGPR